MSSPSFFFDAFLYARKFVLCVSCVTQEGSSAAKPEEEAPAGEPFDTWVLPENTGRAYAGVCRGRAMQAYTALHARERGRVCVHVCVLWRTVSRCGPGDSWQRHASLADAAAVTIGTEGRLLLCIKLVTDLWCCNWISLHYRPQRKQLDYP